MLVLDGSLAIQTDAADGNCGLYTAKICRVVYDILKENTQLQLLLENMSFPAQHSGNSMVMEWKTLRPIFHRHLQEKLPEFYEINPKGDYQPKSYEQLKQYHMNFRWLTGNQLIKDKQKKYQNVIAEEYEAWQTLKRYVK